MIDSHVHLWDLKRMDYPWLDQEPVIKRSFLTEDYRKASEGMPVEKIVVVQGECVPGAYMEEVRFIREQALKDDRIRGIVAYAPLEDPNRFEEAMDVLNEAPLVKGVRRMYDDDPSLCCSTPFIASLQKLPAYHFSFDISIKPHAMKETIRMIEKCPDTLFVLDHLGKPDIANSGLEAFKRDMARLASFPNTVAKISGLTTEANREKWTADDLAPYINHALEHWGFDRLLFGSDWPVVLLAATYEKWVSTVMHIIRGCSPEEAAKLLYPNAARVYRL